MQVASIPSASRCGRLLVEAASKGSSGSSSGSGGKRRRNGRARLPWQYEVKVITPPPRSLGIYSLEPNQGCGDEFELEGEGSFVVSRTVHKYKLERGKYVKDHKRLEVEPTGRYFLNRMLDDIYQQSASEDEDTDGTDPQSQK